MGLILLDCHHYVPPTTISNHFFEEFLDTSHEWIKQRTGIHHRHYSDEGVSQMVVKMVQELSIPRPEKIKLLITSSVSQDYMIPTISAMAHKALGLGEDVFTFDYNMACTGFIGGFILAEKILGPGEQALVIGAERLSEKINFRDRTTAMLFGDGAAVAWLEKTEEPFIHCTGTIPTWDLTLGLGDREKIEMDGKNIYKFGTSTLHKVITRLLEEGGLTMEEIDHVVLHQANERILQSVAKKTGHREKFYTNLQHVGNTSSASIGLCLGEMKEKGMLKNKDTLLLVGFGGGLTYGGGIVQWNGL